MGKFKPSVVETLKSVSKNLKDLESYSNDVDGDDPTYAIFYSKLQDQINEKIREIETV